MHSVNVYVGMNIYFYRNRVVGAIAVGLTVLGSCIAALVVADEQKSGFMISLAKYNL